MIGGTAHFIVDSQHMIVKKQCNAGSCDKLDHDGNTDFSTQGLKSGEPKEMRKIGSHRYSFYQGRRNVNVNYSAAIENKKGEGSTHAFDHSS